MNKLLVVVTLAFSAAAFPGTSINYTISFPNADHHEAEVTIVFPELGRNPLQLRMSRSSPGRYALHEFSKNVYNVRIVDGNGNRLQFARPNAHEWNVAGHDGMVTVSYTVFGDLCDGTYLAIDGTHAHLNMPATFMWAKGLEARPIEIHFEPADPAWKIATQLPAGNSPTAFTAPNLQFFMDSPVEISDLNCENGRFCRGQSLRQYGWRYTMKARWRSLIHT